MSAVARSCIAERGEDVVDGFGLIAGAESSGAFDLRACEPGAKGRRSPAVRAYRVIAGDRIEASALFYHVGEAVAIRDQNALVHAIGQADEGGEFVPGEGRTAGAEFCLVGVEVSPSAFQRCRPRRCHRWSRPAACAANGGRSPRARPVSPFSTATVARYASAKTSKASPRSTFVTRSVSRFSNTRNVDSASKIPLCTRLRAQNAWEDPLH